MRIVCQQTSLMKYHAVFVIFEKAAKFLNCRLLQIIGGALRVKGTPILISVHSKHLYVLFNFRRFEIKSQDSKRIIACTASGSSYRPLGTPSDSLQPRKSYTFIAKYEREKMRPNQDFDKSCQLIVKTA